jgi:Arc/MetJ family transcription regulator
MVLKRKKTTVYVDEELLRSAKILAARTDRKEYEVFEEALRRYLGSSDQAESVGGRAGETALRDLRPREGRVERPLPGAPDEEAEELQGGATSSDAVLAEREERGY